MVGNVKVGRYPFGITLVADDSRLYVANVGVFQYTHLIPRGPVAHPGRHRAAQPHRRSQRRLPAVLPGRRLPRRGARPTRSSRSRRSPAGTISGLPLALRDPEGIRCGYVAADRDYKIPGLGSPNVDESSSVYVLDLANPAAPAVLKKVKTGLQVGEVEDGIATTGASHPNSVAVGSRAIFVSNGNNDSISVLDPGTLAVVRHLQPGPAGRRRSPAARRAAGVAGAQPRGQAAVRRRGRPQRGGGAGRGRRPSCRWPAASPPAGGRARVKLSADGRRLFVATAKGRGAPPNVVGEGADQNGHPKHSVFGSMQMIDVPLDAETAGPLHASGC